jgi:hypothetical protein
MNNIKKITGFSFVAGMFLVAVLATSTPSSTGIALAQNMSNQTAVNQTSTTMNQTDTQSDNNTSINQTSASKPKLTTSDVQDIRKTLEEIRKDIADGKATEALQAINDIDDKMLVSMSDNPPPMLEKSTGNDNNK